jgi:hypothetical protein
VGTVWDCLVRFSAVRFGTNVHARRAGASAVPGSMIRWLDISSLVGRIPGWRQHVLFSVFQCLIKLDRFDACFGGCFTGRFSFSFFENLISPLYASLRAMLFWIGLVLGFVVDGLCLYVICRGRG